MTTPNMSIVALERALQNCSLNRSTTTTTATEDGVGVGVGVGFDRPATSNPSGNLINSDATLELNSHVALPYQWEQCLDLETGEIYYINWQTGTKAREDPREKPKNFGGVGDDYYSREEEEEEEEVGREGNSYYDKEVYYSSSSSSAASSPCSSSSTKEDFREDGDHVLVVAGCKSCLMYFMLPKRVIQCPKCKGLLLHVDRLENGSF